MEKMNRILLVFSLIALVMRVFSDTLLGSVYMTVPGDILTLGNLTAGTDIEINLSWNNTADLTVIVALDGIVDMNKVFQASPTIFRYNLGFTGFYTIRIVNMEPAGPI